MCPACASRDVLLIIQGLPDAAGEKLVQEGRARYGGCRVFGNGRDPVYECRECGTQFGGGERRQGRRG